MTQDDDDDEPQVIFERAVIFTFGDLATFEDDPRLTALLQEYTLKFDEIGTAFEQNANALMEEFAAKTGLFQGHTTREMWLAPTGEVARSTETTVLDVTDPAEETKH